jgi:hypothetical protein
VPARAVNWGGAPASIEQWCAWLGELSGLAPRFEESERTVAALPLDLTRLHAIAAPARVDLREGLRRMVEARAPERLRRNEL